MLAVLINFMRHVTASRTQWRKAAAVYVLQSDDKYARPAVTEAQEMTVTMRRCVASLKTGIRVGEIDGAED